MRRTEIVTGLIKSVASPCTVIFAVALTACSNLSRLDVPKDPTGVPTVNSIVQRVRCELAVLADPNYVHNETLQSGDFMVAVQLSLTVNDDGSLAPSFTYSNGLFTFDAGAKFEASREQNVTQKLIYSIRAIQDEIKKAKKLSKKLQREINPFSCPQVDTNLAGDLGLMESVEMALTNPDLDQSVKLSDDGAFGGYVTFVVTKSLNAVGPTWALTHFKGPGGLGGLSEVNTDKVTFAFARRVPSEVYPSGPAAKAEILLNQILQNEIVTQLNGIRTNLR